MSYYRTAEHRRLRAELIQRWKPWEQSTGPRTAEGKATASRNGYRGGERKGLRALAKLLHSFAVDGLSGFHLADRVGLHRNQSAR